MPTVATSDFPSLRVRFLSDAGPSATNGTWVDITDFVKMGTVRRGRTYQTDQFDAGSCSVVLNTTTRLFDPEFTTGAYYGNLVPMRQLEITSTWSSTTYSVFRGYIKSWGNTVQDNALWETTVTAYDALFWFGLQALPDSWYGLAVAGYNPSHWWRLDESAGATAAIDSGFSQTPAQGNYANNPTFDVTGLVTYDNSRTCVTFNGSSQYMQATLGSEAVGNFTVACWFSSTESSVQRIIWGLRTTSGAGTAMTLSAAGAITDTGGGFASGTGYNDGNPHHLVITLSGTTTTMYIDGASITTGSLSVSGTWGYFAFGIDPFPDTFPNFQTFNGKGQEVSVIFGTALNAAQVSDLYTAGKTAFSGVDTGTVVNKILNWKGYPASLRAINSGSSLIGAYELPGGKVIDYFRQLAQTELGQNYVDGSGVFTWRSRAAVVATDTRSRVSQAVFGDGTSTASYQFDNDEFSFPLDDNLIRNPVVAARSGGVSVTVTDSAGVNKYGYRDWSAPTALDSTDNVMYDRAWYLLGRYKELGSRLDSLRFTPRKDAANLWPQVLGREIGDRVTVARTPLGTGNAIVREVMLERIEHRFSIGPDWRTTFGGGIAETTVPFIWDNSTYGKWDSAIWGY